MLRGNSEPPRTAAPPRTDRPSAGEGTDLPGLDRPYTTGDRPPGVLFYCAKQSFWRPYHLLQQMEFAAEQLTLGFATEDIVIRGRSLHPLYVALASQTVCRVVEQGERYVALAETGPYITGIERRPHPSE